MNKKDTKLVAVSLCLAVLLVFGATVTSLFQGVHAADKQESPVCKKFADDCTKKKDDLACWIYVAKCT